MASPALTALTTTAQVGEFISSHSDRFGVAPISRVGIIAFPFSCVIENRSPTELLTNDPSIALAWNFCTAHHALTPPGAPARCSAAVWSVGPRLIAAPVPADVWRVC